jgi:hypothetical protein
MKTETAVNILVHAHERPRRRGARRIDGLRVQVVVRAQSYRDERRLQPQNAKRLLNESDPVKFPIFFTVEYPRSGDKAVCKVYAGELPNVIVAVNDSDGKVDEWGEARIEPAMRPACSAAAVLDDDAVADGIRVVPASALNGRA